MVIVKQFAQIPDYNGVPSRINSFTTHARNFYVCTETSGGLIYKISPSGKVSRFFDVAAAIRKSTGRAMSFSNSVHGGLRSVAFHPQFQKNGLFYVSAMEERPSDPSKVQYLADPKDTASADSVVIEWKYNHKKRVVDDMSYRQVLRIGIRVFNHPIKQILFRGNLLYIAHGDASRLTPMEGGGQRNDPYGKILRINPLKRGSLPYTIPSSNPFQNSSRLGEIYAFGFRNPHNLCFSKSNELFVTDIGRDNAEEINIVKAGKNYGWSEREGPWVHKATGGTISGVGALPKNDARFGYIYPVAFVGHAVFKEDKVGLAGSCPIENGSLLNNVMLYSNFPDGDMYYSFLKGMRNAVTKGRPSKLSQTATYRARLFFDHDGNENTEAIRVGNFLELVRMDRRFGGETRADIRFGQGPSGEIYITCKKNGRVYTVTSSMT